MMSPAVMLHPYGHDYPKGRLLTFREKKQTQLLLSSKAQLTLPPSKPMQNKLVQTIVGRKERETKDSGKVFLPRQQFPL